jgi:2-polyprenyl-6-methoxyphenol hydroxylase-like FAD-dependent oxidoreductase
VIISQDEVDTWTIHLPIPLDTDIESLDPEKLIQQVLGGSLSPYPIKVDKILVTSVWRPNICLADSYRSAGGRLFLSGDAAHQNIPTGGYGMNSAVGDSFDIGWKVSTVIKGYGGPHLLDSYEHERRPVAARNIKRSGVHMAVHQAYYAMVAEAGADLATARTDEGKALRKKVAELVE